MKKIVKVSFLLAVIFSVSGCNTAQVLEWFYFDREKFSLESNNDEAKKTIYLCVKGKTEAETKSRANTANTYFTKEQDNLVKEFAEGMMKRLEENDDKASFIAGEVKANLLLQAQMEKVMTDVEKLFQCKIIGLEK